MYCRGMMGGSIRTVMSGQQWDRNVGMVWVGQQQHNGSSGMVVAGRFVNVLSRHDGRQPLDLNVRTVVGQKCGDVMGGTVAEGRQQQNGNSAMVVAGRQYQDGSSGRAVWEYQSEYASIMMTAFEPLLLCFFQFGTHVNFDLSSFIVQYKCH